MNVPMSSRRQGARLHCPQTRNTVEHTRVEAGEPRDGKRDDTTALERSPDEQQIDSASDGKSAGRDWRRSEGVAEGSLAERRHAGARDLAPVSHRHVVHPGHRRRGTRHHLRCRHGRDAAHGPCRQHAREPRRRARDPGADLSRPGPPRRRQAGPPRLSAGFDADRGERCVHDDRTTREPARQIIAVSGQELPDRRGLLRRDQRPLRDAPGLGPDGRQSARRLWCGGRAECLRRQARRPGAKGLPAHHGAGRGHDSIALR